MYFNEAHLVRVRDTEAVYTEVRFALAVIAECINPAAFCSCYVTSFVCSKHTVAFTASFPVTAFGALDQCMLISFSINV